MEIQEGNKIIAEFMGIERKIYSDTPSITYYNFNNAMTTPKGMKYNTSWDWLMPVVEKIESKGITVRIKMNNCFIAWSGCNPDDVNYIDEDGESKIDGTYKGILSFINGYNSL